MTEQEVKYYVVNEEKVKRFIEEKKKEIEESIKHTEMSAWLLGRLIATATIDWTKQEISYLYTLLEKTFGLSRTYLRMCKHFATKFPQLPFLLKTYKIPYSFWVHVSQYKISDSEIIAWVERNKHYLEGLTYSELIKEFKSYFGYKIKSRDLWCEVCEVELKEDDKDRTWRFVPVCDNCLNEIKNLQDQFLKDVQKYIDLCEEKDIKIKNLKNIIMWLDKAIADIKAKTENYLLKIRNGKLTEEDKQFLVDIGANLKVVKI